MGLPSDTSRCSFRRLIPLEPCPGLNVQYLLRPLVRPVASMGDSPLSSGFRRYRPSPVETVGTVATILLVGASTLEAGRPLQKWPFLAPPVLFAVAYLNGEVM
jgi:hypothetical protein